MSNEQQIPLGKDVGTGLKKISTSSTASGLQTGLFTLASSLAAVVIALAICAVLLAVTGKNPWQAYSTIIETGTEGDKLLEMMKRATPLIFSATAVAVGFKMNLFNIGVEGQYLFAALIAATVGSRVSLPAPLHVLFILIVAVVAGAAWASIAAMLKVGRGVHEVISTIMLNYVALSVIQWLFENFFRDKGAEGLNVKTKLLPASGRMPDIVDDRLGGMFFVALFVVFLYWVLVFKSRFGFRLRSSGLNPGAARTSGISANKMIFIPMLVSGGIAGLVAMQARARRDLTPTAPTHPHAATASWASQWPCSVAPPHRHRGVGAAVGFPRLHGRRRCRSPRSRSRSSRSSRPSSVITVVIVNEVVRGWRSARLTEQPPRSHSRAAVQRHEHRAQVTPGDIAAPLPSGCASPRQAVGRIVMLVPPCSCWLLSLTRI
jgi:ABC-type uncharacterized transport system permease subunit